MKLVDRTPPAKLEVSSPPAPKPASEPTAPKIPVSPRAIAPKSPPKPQGLVMNDRDCELLLFAINTLLSAYQHHQRTANEKDKYAHAEALQKRLEAHVRELNAT